MRKSIIIFFLATVILLGTGYPLCEALPFDQFQVIYSDISCQVSFNQEKIKLHKDISGESFVTVWVRTDFLADGAKDTINFIKNNGWINLVDKRYSINNLKTMMILKDIKLDNSEFRTHYEYYYDNFGKILMVIDLKKLNTFEWKDVIPDSIGESEDKVIIDYVKENYDRIMSQS